MFAWEELGMVPVNKLESFGRELQMIPRGVLERDTWLVPLLTQVTSLLPAPGALLRVPRLMYQGDSVSPADPNVTHSWVPRTLASSRTLPSSEKDPELYPCRVGIRCIQELPHCHLALVYLQLSLVQSSERQLLSPSEASGVEV